MTGSERLEFYSLLAPSRSRSRLFAPPPLLHLFRSSSVRSPSVDRAAAVKIVKFKLPRGRRLDGDN